MTGIFDRLGHGGLLLAKTLMAPATLGVTGLVRDGQGRVLLVSHGYRKGWHLPGGGADPGEGAQTALRRELKEEIGLEGGAVALIGLFTARVGLVTNVVGLYRVDGATIAFTPSFEIREIVWADPKAPLDGLSPATARRLAELNGAPVSEHW